jgi:NDP-sugar pyrophosphorylase family protein
LSVIRTAFIPGAGLGTRLRPLTEHRPKPLVPVHNRPLITFVFDALIDVGIERFVVNTHHCPETYDTLIGSRYRGREVHYIHEPVLLETGGGLRNARELLGEGPVLVHNGDVLASLNLSALIEAHRTGGAEVTALLRGKDGPLQVRFDPASGRVLDFRGVLGATGGRDTLFTGAYVIEPAFVDRIPAGQIISVVPIFLEMLREGAPIAGVLDDSGQWADLGDRASYLAAHRGEIRVHETARVAPDAEICGFAALGADVEIGPGAVIEDTVIWEEVKIASGCVLRDCIVRDHRVVTGTHTNTDL